jgi:glycosyltransferase involved in cell wall biosynthesis
MHIGLGELPQKQNSAVSKSFQILVNWGRKTVSWLDSQKIKPSWVIVYGGGAQYIYRLLPWCRKNHIPLIADVVEWYHPKQLYGGFFGPFYISSEIALRYLIPRCNGIIAISSYLEKYYFNRGCEVIRIPPTLDVNRVMLVSSKNERDTGEKLKLVYAGTPGKKDLLNNLIQAVYKIDQSGESINLKVIGPTLEQVLSLTDMEKIPDCVDVVGRVPQQEVFRIIQQADFSVLLREKEVFTQAGFPTKFVESLANGVPVIANLTSDLERYLIDGKNGLVCENYSSEALTNTLKRALLLTDTQKRDMRQLARQEAEHSFNSCQFAHLLSQYLLKLCPYRNGICSITPTENS